MSQQGHPTLATLTVVLKHPVHGEEHQAVENNIADNISPPKARQPLTSAKFNAVMQYLFIYRLRRTQSQHKTPDVQLLKPVMHSLTPPNTKHGRSARRER